MLQYASSMSRAEDASMMCPEHWYLAWELALELTSFELAVLEQTQLASRAGSDGQNS
jgi:hypothetical protein